MDGYRLCNNIQDLTPLQIHFTAYVFKEKLQMVAAALGADVNGISKTHTVMPDAPAAIAPTNPATATSTNPKQHLQRFVEDQAARLPPVEAEAKAREFYGPLYLHRSRTDAVGPRPETKVYSIKEYIQMRRKQWGFERQPLGKVLPQKSEGEESFAK